MIYYFFPRMLAALATFVVLIVLTRILTPADFGRYGMTVLIGYVGFAFTFAWLASSVPRFHHTQDYDGRATASILGIACAQACILVPLVAISFALPWEAATLYSLGAAYSLAHTTHQIGLSGLRVLEAGPQYAAVTLLRPAFSVLLAFIFVQVGWGYEGAVWGFVVGTTIAGSFGLIYVYRRTGIAKPNRHMIKSLLIYGKPLAVGMAVSSLFLLASQTFLASIHGLEAVGYFVAAQTLAMRAISMPMLTLSNVASAPIFEAHETAGEDAVDRELKKHFSFLILFTLPIAATLVFANEAVSNIFFPNEFQSEAGRNLRLLALAAFLVGVQGSYFSFAFTLARRTTLQLFVTLATLLTHALISLFCIFTFGPLGASIGFLLSAIISLMSFHFVGERIYRSLLPKSEILSALPGVFILAPFALYANQIDSVPASLALMALGAVAFWLTLVISQQTAAGMVWSRLRRAARQLIR